MDSTIIIDIAKAQEAITHLKEVQTELKEDLKDLARSLDENSEEVKDIFYIAETTRKRLEELSEKIDLAFVEYDKLFDKKELQKEKKLTTMVQAFITAAALIYAYFAKAGF